MLTAHDYSSARFIESSAVAPPVLTSSESTPTTKPSPRGIDICLVGDSLAMVACGYENTTLLTLDELLYHCRSVARGCKSSLLVSDMPFGTFTVSTTLGVTNAVRIIQEGHMDAVKVEGGKEIVPLVKKLVEGGIPVMGHVGLTPQRQSALSGYRVQGKTVASAMGVYHDALAIQAAGAFAIVLEAVPSRLAEFITSRLDIPTIGIGAGVGCAGQVLVQLDMLGVSSLEKGPRFLKKYEEWEGKATDAIGRYVEDVRGRTYPEEKHGYPMPDAEWEGFLEAIKAEEVKK
jgi:3-methyl-2-oxobutanoate hydroxymethyltransferase